MFQVKKVIFVCGKCRFIFNTSVHIAENTLSMSLIRWSGRNMRNI